MKRKQQWEYRAEFTEARPDIVANELAKSGWRVIHLLVGGFGENGAWRDIGFTLFLERELGT